MHRSSRRGDGLSRRALATLTSVLMVAGMLVWLPGVAAAGPSESDFFAATNSARANAGLRSYSWASDLASVARRQAERMASSGSLHHNPNLGGEVSSWQSIGENVGVGPSWRPIQDAFMASPGHRSNILHGSFTQAGVGTAVDGEGTLWVAVVFRLPAGASAPTSSPSGSSGGSSSAATTAARTTAGSVAAPAAPAPSPTEVLRGKLKEVRSTLKKDRTSRDPLRSALDYSRVMSTIGVIG